MRARVATFNIHHGLGSDGRLDLDRTIAVIRRIDPQLIALQELDRGLGRSGRIDQPAAIAEATGLHVRFCPTVTRRDGGEYGIALAATEPLAVEFQGLPRHRDEEPRGAITARWREAFVVATHLSTFRAARRAQVRALAAAIGETTGPALLLGDLNDRGPGLRPLRGAGLSLSPGRRIPRLLWWRLQPIDRIVGKGVSVLSSGTLDTNASDHAPVFAEVELPVV
jgi:endonuclease/exonuclease/phosphatase family metal-dependent hydrolase